MTYNDTTITTLQAIFVYIFKAQNISGSVNKVSVV